MATESEIGFTELESEIRHLRTQLRAQTLATRIVIVVGAFWAFGFAPGIAALVLFAICTGIAGTVNARESAVAPSSEAEPPGPDLPPTAPPDTP